MDTKTKLEIINEVATFYNKGNRAVEYSHGDNRSCYYYTPDGKHCGVGHFLTDPETFQDKFGKGSVWGVKNAILEQSNGKDNIDNHFRVEYRGHGVDFWADIQEFHDTEKYWDNNGLTLNGTLRRDELIEKYRSMGDQPE